VGGTTKEAATAVATGGLTTGGSTKEIATGVATGGVSTARKKLKQALELPEFPTSMGGKDIELPGRESEEVQRSAMKERQRLRMQRGRRSTMLTSLRRAGGGGVGEQLG
jgi:hypothetical protein